MVWRTRGLSRSRPDLPHPRFFRPLAGAAPDLPGQRGGHIRIQAHHLADLADRRAGAEVDHRGAEPGAVAAVFFIDILDHLLAALMLEIDIDVRRLAPVFGDETLRHHGDGFRPHIGDAERIADDGIGRRAAPLAQDVLAAGKAV